MVKSFGGQRESDGVVVPLIGVQHNAPGGKGPQLLITCATWVKHQGMTGFRPVQTTPTGHRLS